MNQRLIRFLRLTIGVLCLLLPVMPDSHSIVFGQNSDKELNQDIAKLDSLLSDRKLDSIEVTVDRESIKWQHKDRQSFIAYMSKACSMLSSYDIGDVSRRASLLTRYSISVLTSGDLPLQDHVQFVSFLMFDPIVIDEAAWKRLRKQKAQLWLAAQRRVERSVDRTFDFNDLPELNVPTPAVSGLPNGISPESIKDPNARAQYEQAIAQNSAKARKYNDQYWLKRNGPDFYKSVERYLVNAYSRPPADQAELEQLLAQYVDDNSVRTRILEEVRNGGLAVSPR